VTRHVFLDEIKRQGYVAAAVVVPPGDLVPLRSVVRGLVLPGQRRVHMKDERDSRRREIAAALVDAGVEVVISDAAAEAGETRLVLEQDDSLVQWDAQRFIELARPPGAARGCATTTCGPRRSNCWRFRMRWCGAGRAAGSGVAAWTRRTSDPPRVNPHGPGNARSPSAASVRTGLGLTSRSSTQRALPIIRAEGGHGAGPVWTAVRPAASRNQDAQDGHR